MTQTREHKTYPIVVPGMGYDQCQTVSTFNANAKAKHTKGKKKVNKHKRNFRINGVDRGREPSFGASSKYVRSGGPQRHDNRVARNLARQERLRTQGAERRMGQINRRLDRRVLKAAEHLIDALD